MIEKRQANCRSDGLYGLERFIGSFARPGALIQLGSTTALPGALEAKGKGKRQTKGKPSNVDPWPNNPRLNAPPRPTSS